VYLEGAQRKPIVCRDENDARQCNFRCVERLNYPKTIQPRHLHIEENQIGAMFFYCRDGRLTAIGFAGNLHRGLFAEQADNLAPRRRFVVNNQDAE
jgi:hypothetical protein